MRTLAPNIGLEIAEAPSARVMADNIAQFPRRKIAEIYVTHELCVRGQPTSFLFSDPGLRRREGWSNGYLQDGSIYAPGMGHEPRRVVVVTPEQGR